MSWLSPWFESALVAIKRIVNVHIQPLALLQTINDPADCPASAIARRPKALATELRASCCRRCLQDWWAPQLQPGHGGADRGLAPCLQHPGRPHVWDVGHQTYPHKILTGRRERMPPCASWAASRLSAARREPVRHLGTAHSSRPVSGGLGMAAMAAKRKGEDRRAWRSSATAR